jgi:thioredoxin reductase (NADPH)
MEKIQNVVIIGSGPAGYTAAIYTGRAQLNPLLITGKQKGGQLMTTTEVENFPGYCQEITGPLLMEDLEKQCLKFSTTILNNVSVTSVDMSTELFKLVLDNDEVITTRSIIIATGASSLWLNLPDESLLVNKGISTCATCDGPCFFNKQVVVVGGGDSAMEEAIFLSRIAKHVTIINRSDNFRASKIMFERASQNPKITILKNAQVKMWLKDNEGYLCGGILTQAKEQQQVEFKLDFEGAFIAIGHKPNTDFLENQLETDKQYLVLKQNTMTSREGVFACGDVTDQIYKQAITAAAQGCQAAIDCERWLSSK